MCSTNAWLTVGVEKRHYESLMDQGCMLRKEVKPLNQRFLQACTKLSVDRTPVWYMRQAGRYQPEYRKIREKYSLVEICEIPELCAEVTKLPVEQLDVDAAILFSDIMIPVGAMGLPFEIRENVGPVIETPIRTQVDVDRLQLFEPMEKLPYVLQTIQLLHKELTVPLIGFSGAPFTLASYMIEGGPSKDYRNTKAMMWQDRALWQQLMTKLGDIIIIYLKAQIAAGASAVQLFDSWVGSLSVPDFREYVFPTMQRIFSALQETGVPLIYFGVNTSSLLPLFAETGASVVGVDWRTPLTVARERTHHNVALQGNLDPLMLFAPWDQLKRRAGQILAEGNEEPGFVFNLGHGVLPGVQVDTLRRLTDFVHEYSLKLRK